MSAHTEKKTLLIIGVRRKCYEAAIRLGHDVILWSDGPLPGARKKRLKDWIEIPYNHCKNELSQKAEQALQKHKIDRVIANTEETVVLGSMVRSFLGLKTLATDITNRFHNKFVMKNCAQEAGIPITRYELITEETTPEQIIEKLGLPVVVKPVDDSGASGVQVLKTQDEVKNSIKKGLLAEAFVEGSEVSVETFVSNGRPLFHNVTEYLHQWKKSVVPADLTPSLKEQIIQINDKVISHFGVDRGVTHAEFYLTPNGPVFGEIAIRPPGGYYMDLIEKVYQFDPWEAYVKLSCGIKPASLVHPPAPHGFAAVLMLHPGKGHISSIEGEEKVKDHLKGLIEISIRKKVGDWVDAHENTSNEVGHLLLWAPTRKEVLRDIEFAETHLKIEVS